jgi:tetratricopeptide (TPR) repeat protein
MKEESGKQMIRSRWRNIIRKAKRNGVYIAFMGGVLDRMSGNTGAQANSSLTSNYSIIAYLLGVGVIILSILIIRLMIKYYQRLNYKKGLHTGTELGKEELISEQEQEEAQTAQEELEVELADETKEDIDYDMVIDDIDQYASTLGDEEKDQPIVQNINKFVTGYKFLKPPDVAVLSLTKRFDEYEVGIALPEAQKGASKISEFVPFEESTRKEIQEEFDSTAQLNNSMVGMPDMGGMGPIITSRIESLGKKISETFIPENIMKNLKSIDDPIIIESNDGELLWETIHNGENFIALEHPIGRVLKTKEEARINEFERGKKLRFLMICNPTGDLESTEKEVNYIESILKQKVVIDRFTGKEATKENILNSLMSGDYDVIHFAGHADSESEGEAALLASDGKLFSSEIKNSLNGRPYVYLNACGSGREAMDESKDSTQVSDTEGLASAFILGGAVGFMGAMWRLPDKSAAEFSVSFYEGLIKNLKVGEACRQARLALTKQNPSDITWAAFLQYGDPVQRLREKKTEKEGEVTTDDEVEDDAEIEVVDEDEIEHEKSLEEEGEEITDTEKSEPEKPEMTEEERFTQYQGWLLGGMEHMKIKKFEDAITAFDSAIGLDPERYNAWHLTGNALRELRRYNEALECYDKALERESTVDEIWYDKALALGAIGRFDEAMDCKDVVETLQVGRVKEWLKKANELMTRGGIKDAIKIYDRITNENDKYPLPWYLKGIAYAELAEHKKAIKCFDNSLKHAKNFSLGYQKKAGQLQIMKRYDQALDDIDKALELNPINENALALKSEILISLGRYKAAMDAYDQILAINKNNADILLRKADILRRYNKYEKSLECYDGVIRLNPENSEAWYQKSQLLNKLGTDESAELECYRSLIEMDIVDPEILKGVAGAIMKKDDIFGEKLKWFEKMIMVDPSNGNAWLNKGTVLEKLNKNDAAAEAYEKVLELDSESIEAMFRAGKILEQRNEHTEASEYFSQILKLEPANTDALLSLAKIQFSTGKYQDALHGFKKLFKLMPNNVDILESLRDIFYELGKKKNALTISKKLLNFQPDDVNVRYSHVKIQYDFKNYTEVIKYSEKLIERMPEDYELLIMRAEAFSNLNELDKALACWNQIIKLKSKSDSNTGSNITDALESD